MENLKKLLLIPMLVSVIVWILFNPYIYYSNSEFISNFAITINDFCKNISLNYRFSNDDVLNLLRFLEYFIFGILSAILYKVYFKKIWTNVLNPMFLGLSIAALEVYLRNCGIYKLEIGNIWVSFFEFCAGLLIILALRVPGNKKAFSSRYKKNRYSARS